MEPEPQPPGITVELDHVDLDGETIWLLDGTQVTRELADAIGRAALGHTVWITEEGQRIAAIIGADKIPSAEKLAKLWRDYGGSERYAAIMAAIDRAEHGD